MTYIAADKEVKATRRAAGSLELALASEDCGISLSVLAVVEVSTGSDWFDLLSVEHLVGTGDGVADVVTVSFSI